MSDRKVMSRPPSKEFDEGWERTFAHVCPRCGGELLAKGDDAPELVTCAACERRWPPLANRRYREAD